MRTEPSDTKTNKWLAFAIAAAIAVVLLTGFAFAASKMISSASSASKPCVELTAAMGATLDAQRDMEIKVAVTEAAKHAYDEGDGDYAAYLAARDISVPAGKHYGDLAVQVRNMPQPHECKTMLDAARRVHDSYERQHSALYADDKASALIEIDAARAEWDRIAAEYS